MKTERCLKSVVASNMLHQVLVVQSAMLIYKYAGIKSISSKTLK